MTAGHACALIASRVRTEETSQLFSSARLAVGTRCLCPCFYYLFFKIVCDCDVLPRDADRFVWSQLAAVFTYLLYRRLLLSELTVELVLILSDTYALRYIGKYSENTHVFVAYLTVPLYIMVTFYGFLRVYGLVVKHNTLLPVCPFVQCT